MNQSRQQGRRRNNSAGLSGKGVNELEREQNRPEQSSNNGK
jgi:hypothetical protein